VRCTYDLKGLSILGQCPECGLPVRATLLAVVDPKAGELQPIFRPRATAAGLVAWSMAALVSVLCGWGVWIIEVLPSGGLDHYLIPLRYGCVLGVVVSGLGALALISPHANIPTRARFQAWMGTLAYAPLIALVAWLLLGRWDVGAPGGLGQWAATSGAKTLVQLVGGVVAVSIILLLRPNARLLASRSILLREGRVDRQHLLALASVLGLSAAGELVTLIGLRVQAGETFVLIGQLLVLVAAVLFTLGLVGVVIDCWRIRRAVVEPPLSLESLLKTGKPSGTISADEPR